MSPRKYKERPSCPKCNQKQNVIRVIYGLFKGSKIIKRNGKDFILGGCDVSPDNPSHYCKKCKKMFGRLGAYIRRAL